MNRHFGNCFRGYGNLDRVIASGADLRYAFRTFRASPGFTFLAIILLALGIGANTAMFSVIEAVLLRPLPYREPSRLYMVWKSVPAKNLDWDWMGYPAIRDWREQNHVFEDVAAVARPEASIVTLTGGVEPQRIQSAKVEGNVFTVLGAAPLLGRSRKRRLSAATRLPSSVTASGSGISVHRVAYSGERCRSNIKAARSSA